MRGCEARWSIERADRMQQIIEEATGQLCPCLRGERCPCLPSTIDTLGSSLGQREVKDAS